MARYYRYARNGPQGYGHYKIPRGLYGRAAELDRSRPATRRPVKRSYTPRRRTYTRRKTTRRRTYTKRACTCGASNELSAGERFVLAQADPFEPRALGCKIPDSSTQPSVAIACQELNTPTLVSTPATDSGAVAYLPSLTSSIVVGTSSVGGWSWPASFSGNSWTKRTDVIAAVEVARPVAHGLRISSSVAPTSATGYVHLALAVESINNGPTTWQYATTISALSGYSWYKRVTLASLTQTPLTIINKYVDETAFRYLGQDGGQSSGANGNMFHIPLSWGALIIAVEGVPSTAPIQVEMMLHLECIPKNVGVLAGSSAAPASPALLGGAASLSAKTDFAHTEDQQDSYIAQAMSNAMAGAADAGNQFNRNVIQPLARNAGYSVANAAMGAAITGLAGIVGVNNNPGRLALN